jgi:hypothetical protein
MDTTFEYCNENNARIIFILIITPLLFIRGISNKDAIVMAIAIVLFLCEFYWMTFTKPKIYIPK